MKKVLAVLAVLVFAFGFASGASAAQTIEAKALTDHECNDAEWHFVINQVDEQGKPASITVTWANGASEVVPLSEPFESAIAHYTTTSNLDSAVTSATAEIYDGWEGEFNLSHGPCDPADPTPTPTEEVTPSPTPTEEVTPTPTTEVTPTPTTEVTPTPTGEVTPTPTGEVTPTPTGEVTPTPKPDKTPAVEKTVAPVAQLPSTGSGDGGASGGMMAALLAAAGVVLAAGAYLTRRIQRA